MDTAQKFMALELSEADFLRNVSTLLGDICRLVGMEKAIAISARYAPGKISVPSSLSPNSTLSQLIGFEDTKKISDHFGNGFPVDLELANDLSGKNYRRLAYLKARRDGVSTKKAAMLAGISKRSATYLNRWLDDEAAE